MKSFLFKYLISKIYNLIFSIKRNAEPLKIQKGSRCLFLASKTEDIFAAAGGTILLNKDKFSTYSLTNGFRQIIDNSVSYEEKVKARKEEFDLVIEKAGVLYGEFFEDIDDGRLIMRYDKFKSIIISNYDYVFIPNILEPDKDNKSIAILLNELLQERPYKRHIKIVMYEINSALPIVNAYCDIEDKLEEKVELINSINQKGETDFAQRIECLNRYRGANVHKNFAEAFCVLDINEFKKICRLYL